MISSKEMLISRCEEYMEANQSETFEPDTSSALKRP